MNEYIMSLNIDVLPKIDSAQLKIMAKKLPGFNDHKVPQNIKKLGLAHALLEHFLGENWVKEEMCRRYSLKWGALNHVSLENKVHIYNLAEMLFNLQDIEDIETPLKDLCGDDFDSAFSELEAGRVLKSHDIDFKYIKPISKKQFDYDVEILLQKKEWVCGEVKQKTKHNASNDSIKDSLDKARQQLPRDRPGFIFIRVLFPTPKALEQNFEELTTAFKRFYGAGNKRISSIIAWGSYMHPIGRGEEEQRFLAWQSINENCRFPFCESWRLFPDRPFTGEPQTNINWEDIFAIASQ
uniref:Restriction endonuclease n=1 Tax=Roseihalotalea indica TaxID=2867963 RepID=A0AA49GNL5_9BACT|nr:hypothetical protein K4G66_18545 [Tunicatimonas sp. TK19036]